MKKTITTGDRAWLALLTYVVAYDIFALRSGRETLSQAFDRALAHPVRSPLTIATWAALTMHLFDKAIRRELHHARRSSVSETG
jgi:K+-sensing histidine kinase KdpD